MLSYHNYPRAERGRRHWPGKLVLSTFANFLAGVKIPDVNSGFRAFKRGVISRCLPQTLVIMSISGVMLFFMGLVMYQVAALRREKHE
jgi:hypothetical protein